MFSQFSYEKSIDEIKEALAKKVEAYKAKIKDREGRIVKIRKEYDISDADMINLLQQVARQGISNAPISTMSYTIPIEGGTNAEDVRLIGAGVIQSIVTERELIDDETASIKQMERIGRNLRPVTHRTEDGQGEWVQTTWTLRDNELDFLGF